MPEVSMKRALAVAACVWLPCSLAAQTDEPFGLPLSGEAAEAFLRGAQLVQKKALSVGITHSDQCTLTDGTRTTGSLQLWVEKAITEADRKQKQIAPPDLEAWNRQMYSVRLLHQLTFNTDAKNIRNVLSDPTFRVYAVDFSRAFANYSDLRAEKELVRFSRQALERLRALDRPTLDAKLGRWLNGRQIAAMLKRRDKILALAERLVAENGAEAVLY